MDITNGVDTTLAIKEYITFGAFDSRDYGMRLLERSAPTPSEKEKKDGVPYAHGLYDFGMITGERIYENRTVTYRFQLIEHDYSKRKNVQTVLENALIKQSMNTLKDTYSKYYSFFGKVISVDTQDDHEYNRLIVSVGFDCYPFKTHELAEGNDLWDSFNFELDVSQPVDFTINGQDTVSLINPGVASVSPTVTTSAGITVQKGNRSYVYPQGTNKIAGLRLDSGENTLVVTGSADVSFAFNKELI